LLQLGAAPTSWRWSSVRELNTSADNSRAKHSPSHGAKEERIQAREIISARQRASRTRLALRFVDIATGEFEVVQEQVHHHQPHPVGEVCQCCQAAKWKDETADSWCNGKGVLVQLYDPQELKQLFENPLFVVKVWSYMIIIIAFTSLGTSLRGKWQDWEQLDARRLLHVSCSRNNIWLYVYIYIIYIYTTGWILKILI
jgi:hypothetical protein